MMKTSSIPVSIPNSVSVSQCNLMRQVVEGYAIESVGEVFHNIPMPGAEFWQLQSDFKWVTYMILGEQAYCWDAEKNKWLVMYVPAEHIRQSQMITKVH